MMAKTLIVPFKSIALLLPVLWLASCDKLPTAEVKVEASKTDGAKSATALDMAAIAPIYPGAEVKTRISGAGHEEDALLVLKTSDPLEKVAAFYDSKASGLKADMEINEKDSIVRIYGGDGAESNGKGALVTLNRSKDGSGTEIVIVSDASRAQVKKWEGHDWKSQAKPYPLLR